MNLIQKIAILSLMSLIAPGSGQFFLGKTKSAITISLCFIGLFIVSVYSGLIFHFQFLIPYVFLEIAIYGFSIVHAIKTARQSDSQAKLLFSIIYIATFLTVFCISYSISPYSVKKISTCSMERTLMIGDYILSDAGYYKNHSPKSGDLILHYGQTNPTMIFVGRVMGIGGDKVEIRNDTLFINDVLKNDTFANFEPFMKNLFPKLHNLSLTIVPARTVFLIGDNRYNCLDSRDEGPLPVSLVFGKPCYIYFSRNLSRIGKRLQ